ncbi:MAG: hypothetical protein R2855_16395 [Thermomicrobiales bacterium]
MNPQLAARNGSFSQRGIVWLAGTPVEDELAVTIVVVRDISLPGSELGICQALETVEAVFSVVRRAAEELK